MERWREVWRRGFAPAISVAALEELLAALETDDPRLRQGITTIPYGRPCADWPVESACAIAYCAVVSRGGFGTAVVGDVTLDFATALVAALPVESRPFLDFFDDTPRDEMRRELAAEVRLTLAERGAVA